MLTLFKRSFVSTSLRFNAVSDLYANLLTRPHFTALQDNIPETANEESLYSVSKAVVDSVRKSNISNEDKAKVHNDMIESLVNKNYGISNLHLDELKKLNKRVAPESLISLIRSNPARVESSWDLFVKYTDPLITPDDEIVVELLRKIVQMDKNCSEEVDSGIEINEVAQILSLLNNVKDKSLVGEDVLLPLLDEIFSRQHTSLLPVLLEFNLPVEKLLEKLLEATDKQFFYIIQSIPVDDIVSNELLLFRSLDLLNLNASLESTENERENHRLLSKELERIQKVQFLKPTILPEESTSSSKGTFFNEIIDEIQSKNLDENNLRLALKLVRIYGMELGDIKTALDLYHKYLMRYVSQAETLMYEVFLTLSYQAFKTGTSQLQQYAEAFIPASLDIHDTLYSHVLRASILTKSKFSVEDSLALYNSKNQQLNREAKESTLMSQFDEVTEALVLAFLYNNDVEFARVILEGAMGQKLFSGPTATKAIKSHLAIYGEAVEKGIQKEVMEQRILNYLRCL